MTPSEDYCNALFPCGHGVPFLHPDHPGDMSVEIGDVCFRARDGRLLRLFNVTKEAGDPRNQYGLPDGFEIMNIPAHCFQRCPDYIKPGEIVHSQDDVEVFRRCSDTTSINLRKAKQAFVVAQTGAHRCAIIGIERDEIADYIGRNLRSWYLFARLKHHRISESDLILVWGWVKTKNWALGISQSDHTEITVHGECIEDPVEPISLECSDTTFYGKEGPSTTRLANLNITNRRICNPLSDQVIFITYYKAKRRHLLPGTLATLVPSGSSTSHHFNDGRRSNSWIPSMFLRIGRAFSDPSLPVEHHPVDVALDYILKNSDCDIAIASDTDLYEIVGNASCLNDLEHALNDANPSITKRGNTFGILCPTAVDQVRPTDLQVSGLKPQASVFDNGDPAASSDRLCDTGVSLRSVWPTSAIAIFRANSSHLVSWISSKLHHVRANVTALYHSSYGHDCSNDSSILA